MLRIALEVGMLKMSTMRWMPAVSCVLVWLGMAMISQVQAQTVDLLSATHCRSGSFELIARNTDAAHDGLMMTRGLSADPNRNTSDAIAQLSALSMELSAKLLIFTREADMVCGYLLNFSGQTPVVEARYSIGTKSELVRLTSESRFAFGIHQAQAVRAPQRMRGARAIWQQETVVDVSEKAFRELGLRLFPAHVTSLMPKQGNLMLLPTGIVATLPFAALIPEKAIDPISEHVALSILPALSGVRAGRQAGNTSDRSPMVWTGPGRSQDRALVLGNPELSLHSEWSFLPLPGAEAEARSVAAVLPGWAYFGREATAQQFFAHADEADLIYLATHAVSSESDALDGSFVALSDRLVTPREIQRGKFRASLAVLSACQTGLGAPHDGGTIGLARAFNLAGVPAVIMSLWNVDDEATKALMAAFMRYLETRPPQEALSLAMRERRKVDPNPARWASFMYFGFPMVGRHDGGVRVK
jgi:hypothetical protein